MVPSYATVESAMSSGERGAGFATRFVKGSMPVLLVLGLLYALSRKPRQDIPEVVLAEALCAVALWLGWRWMQGTFVTRWAGRLFAAYLALGLVLLPFAVVLTMGQITLMILLMAVPVMLWDLFVRQPHKGRFARARAERRGRLE
ncbi:MAG: hypothetical protein WBG54_00600 [Acidobacteriaceae bacterium]